MKTCTYINVFVYFMLLISSGCRSGAVKETTDNTDSISTIKYAGHLKIKHDKGFTILEVINPWQKAENLSLEYFLVNKGDSIPPELDKSRIIFTPVQSVILMSTTYIPMITALGRQASIKGISGTEYVYDEGIRKMIKEGLIHETGYEENLNRELILKINPELIIAYGIGSESAGYLKIFEDTGIRILYNADYLEEHPLAKAEWIKMFGTLFGLSEKADSVFSAIEINYRNITDSVKSARPLKPKVLLGLPWQNAWYISPGNTYIANLIKDAGGEYIWEDLKSDHAVPMSLENVFVKAAEADFWLNTGNATDIEQILSIDMRLAGLKPVRSGNVYNNNKRSIPGGGNDYWESGALYPDIILKDIASILHPGTFGDYEPFYYRKLNE